MNRCRGRQAPPAASASSSGGLRREDLHENLRGAAHGRRRPPRHRTKPVMEFWVLIGQLEDAVRSAKRVPLSSDVRLDRQAARAIVSQLPAAIPDELREAHRITGNRDELLAQTRCEAARILEEAREESARLLDPEAIVEAAELRAHELLEAAAASERELHQGALRHGRDALDDLDAYLLTLAEAVARGRELLARRNPDQLIERDPDRLIASKNDRSGDRKAALA